MAPRKILAALVQYFQTEVHLKGIARETMVSIHGGRFVASGMVANVNPKTRLSMIAQSLRNL
jgi:hypothetical protein